VDPTRSASLETALMLVFVALLVIAIAMLL
jgi:hypothetical protein